MRVEIGWICVVCAVALGARNALGAQPTKPFVAEREDVVFIGGDRPIFIRIWFKPEKETLAAGWERLIEKIFDQAEVDADDELNWEEMLKVPKAEDLRLSFATGIWRGQAGGLSDSLNPERRETLKIGQLKRYYALEAGPVVWHAPPVDQSLKTALDAAIIRRLDQNGDGKLSKVEWERAETLLELDKEEGELVTAAQLLAPAPANEQMMMQSKAAAKQMMIRQPTPATSTIRPRFFFPISRWGVNIHAHACEESVRVLFNALDHDHDGLLSRDELRFEKELFDRVDTNHDRRVSFGEFVDHLDNQPDVELEAKWGQKFELKVLRDSTKQVEVDGKDPGRIVLGSGRSVCELIVGPAYPIQKPAPMPLFNEDGEEISPAQDKGGEALEKLMSQACVTLMPDSPAATFFDLIDRNHDQRLTRRELRGAWEAVSAAIGQNPPEAIGPGDLPSRHTLRIALGPSGRIPMTKLNNSTAAGPIWFMKMDLNGDGEVSQREFLGPLEAFKRLDRNGDGVISADEAQKTK